MKVLITGLTGFIGTDLSSKLKQEGIGICAILRKGSNKEALEKDGIKCFVDNDSVEELRDFLNKEKIEGIIHLASYFIAEHKSKDINELVDSNILFSAKVLEAAVRSGIRWFINTGTFWQHYKNKDYFPVNLYAATKQAFEDIAKFYIENFDINFVTLKLNDTYGPDDKRRKIFNLWKEISGTGQVLEMSAGEQLIDTVYVDDVVDAYAKLIRLLGDDRLMKLKGKDFAASSGKPIKLKSLAKKFSKVANKELNIKWGARPYRKNEVMIPWSKGRRVPGWKPKVSIEEGIKKFLEK